MKFLCMLTRIVQSLGRILPRPIWPANQRNREAGFATRGLPHLLVSLLQIAGYINPIPSYKLTAFLQVVVDSFEARDSTAQRT